MGQAPVGVVTYGIGAIGNRAPRTAHSFLPEFEDELARANATRLPIDEFSSRLSDFFARQWGSLMPGPAAPAGNMEFLVGGYDDGAPYGRVFEFKIPHSPRPTETMPNEFGISFGGQTEHIARLLQGFDPNAPNIAQALLSLNDNQKNQLENELRQRLGAPIPFQFLPLQDGVDLSIFLIRATIGLQSLAIGIRGVGGAIDVATITRTGGFKPIQQKTITGEF